MASTITIFRESTNSYYQVGVDLYANVLAPAPYGTPDGSLDYYLMIYTTIRKTDNTAFPQFVVRNLSDVPPDYSGAPLTNFSELMAAYVDYFLTVSEFGMSSSSSLSSSSSSSMEHSSSSSLSSIEYSSSSSFSLSSESSSSSTEVRSTSSSSSTQVKSSSSSSTEVRSTSSSSSTEVKSSSSSSSTDLS